MDRLMDGVLTGEVGRKSLLTHPWQVKSLPDSPCYDTEGAVWTARTNPALYVPNPAVPLPDVTSIWPQEKALWTAGLQRTDDAHSLKCCSGNKNQFNIVRK